MTYIARQAGAYIVAPSANYTGESWGYSMIVNVLHGSTVSAAGPSGVKVGHKIKVAGQASAAGSVTLQLNAGGWQTVAQGSTRSDGTYKLPYKATHRALQVPRAFGANGYIGSKSSKVKVRVHN